MDINQKNQDCTKKPNYGLTLLGISLAVLMASLVSTIVNIALPTIAKDLNTSYTSIQWIVLSYLIIVITCCVAVGRIGDMFGKKKLFLSGIAIFTVASFLCGIAPSIQVLITFRVIQGFGGAVLMALPFAIVGDIIPKEKLHSTMGLLTAMLTLGIALGPSLGGILISAWGWHSVFLIIVPIGVITFVLASGLPKTPIHEKSKSFDGYGMLTLAALLICYFIGITFVESQSIITTILLFLAAIILTIIFVKIESKVSSPLVDLKIG
ncbi:MFS transporter [Desulfosporosinus hippei]|uniref:Major Facilitator Superfamily protein n=1 Tax=Desulfosporosinus hippei DSM 8344 TaxID=1121419 RepID=A0A1G8FP41_9FIRM|nr:MFS transporter [Desulfosporosinus hippei]SDH83953.1 Major Facilitator Superfamily protein [Desulfosporosinus hippei DSM 8344]